MFVFLQHAFGMNIDRISCDVQVDGQMCGKTFTMMCSLDRHTDTSHPGCRKLSRKDFG